MMAAALKPFHGWRMLAVAFVFMMLIVGFALYGLPLFYNLWVAEFGWKRAEIQLGNTLSKLIVGPILGFLAGWLIDKRGPRGVMAAGALFAAVALVGFSFAATLPVVYTFFFCNALGYLCAGPLPNQVLLSHWFVRLRGRVMGIAYVGIGVGGMLVPWVVYYLNGAFGWRCSLRVLAALFAVVMLGLLSLVRRRPADVCQYPDGDAQPAARAGTGAGPVRLGAVLGTGTFWLLAGGSILSIGAIGGVMQNLALYLADICPKDQIEFTKTTVLSLTLCSSIAGRLTMGWLADRWQKRRVMLLTYAIVGLAIPLLLLARQTSGVIYVFAVLFGFGLGADYMLIPLMAAECFGLAALSRILGLIIMSDAVGEALFPYLVAHMRDRTGDYGPGFLLLTGLALLGAVAIACIRYRDGLPACRQRLDAA